MVLLYVPVRVLRASASTMLFPQMGVHAIAVSEIASVVLPLLSPSRKRIYEAAIVVLYAPQFSGAYVPRWSLNNAIEMICLLVVCALL